MSNDYQVKVKITATETVVKTLGKIAKGTHTLSGRLKNLGSSMTAIGTKFTAAGLAMAAGLGVAAKAYMDFEKGMANVSTLVDTGTESMSAMSDQVLAISRRAPVALDDLTKGLYDVRSAGIPAAQAMGVLEDSAKLSVAGLSTSAEAVDVMTSAMNTFRAEGLSSTQIADIFFKTVKAGKNTVSQLAEAFGATAPLVQSAGVSLADFSAATAALTVVGMPASQAQNSLRAAVVALKKPTKEMGQIFAKLGVKDGPELIKTSGGLGAAFSKVYSTAKDMGIVLEKATGRVEGAVAITSLATTQNQAYTDTLTDMTKGANRLGEAYRKQMGTMSASTQLLKNNIQALGISIGAELAPYISQFAQGLQTLIGKFNTLNPVAKHTIAVVAGVGTIGLLAIGGVALALGAVASALGAILTPAGAVVAGVVAVGAAGALIMANWQALSAWFVAMWNEWGGVIQVFIPQVHGVVTLANIIMANWGPIKSFMVVLWQEATAGANAFKSVLNSMIAVSNAVWNALKPIANALTGHRSITVKTVSGGAVAGKRASGGPMSAGRIYRVGERGPEYVTPSRNAYVLPNLSAGGGGRSDLIAIELTVNGQPANAKIDTSKASRHTTFRLNQGLMTA